MARLGERLTMPYSEDSFICFKPLKPELQAWVCLLRTSNGYYPPHPWMLRIGQLYHRALHQAFATPASRRLKNSFMVESEWI